MAHALTEKQRQETQRQLAKLATLIAIEAPVYHQAWNVSTYVAWPLIDAIRAELEKAGVDWRALRKKAKKIEAERRAAAWEGQ